MIRLWTLALTAALLICLIGARVYAAGGDDTANTAADTAADTGDDTTTAGPDAVAAPDSAAETP